MAKVPASTIFIGKAHFKYLPKAARWNKPFRTHNGWNNPSADDYVGDFGLTNNTCKSHTYSEGVSDGTDPGDFPTSSVFEDANMSYKGETVRFLCHMYYPAGYSFLFKELNPPDGGGGGMVKFMRIKSYSEIKSVGHIDIYVAARDIENGLVWLYEGYPAQKIQFTENGYAMPTLEQWQSYQMTVTLDDVPVSEGGMARVLIHKNGKLLADIQNRATMTPEAVYVKTYSYNPYWNGGCPQDQTAYIDEVTCTNITPTTTDAEGNFILESLTDDQPV